MKTFWLRSFQRCWRHFVRAFKFYSSKSRQRNFEDMWYTVCPLKYTYKSLLYFVLLWIEWQFIVFFCGLFTHILQGWLLGTVTIISSVVCLPIFCRDDSLALWQSFLLWSVYPYSAGMTPWHCGNPFFCGLFTHILQGWLPGTVAILSSVVCLPIFCRDGYLALWQSFLLWSVCPYSAGMTPWHCGNPFFCGLFAHILQGWLPGTVRILSSVVCLPIFCRDGSLANLSVIILYFIYHNAFHVVFNCSSAIGVIPSDKNKLYPYQTK